MCYIIYSGASYNSNSSKSPNYGLLEKDDSIQLSTAILADVYPIISSNNYVNMSSYFEKTVQVIESEKRKVKIKIKGSKTGKPTKLKISKKSKLKISKKSKLKIKRPE